jgi:hypothetical protein
MTNAGTRLRRPSRRTWLSSARALAVVAGVGGLALVAAACGGSPSATGSEGSSNAGGSTTAQPTSSQKALAFSSCMRSQGVSKYPDPSSGGELPKVSPQELGVSSATFEAGKTACAHLLPSGAQPTQAASQRVLGKLVSFAGCMRSHEVSNWPDPTPVSAQAPPGAPPYTFNLQGLQGLDGRSFSPQITTAMNECFRLTHLTDAEVPWSN